MQFRMKNIGVEFEVLSDPITSRRLPGFDPTAAYPRCILAH
jgi:hypothetical protein